MCTNRRDWKKRWRKRKLQKYKILPLEKLLLSWLFGCGGRTQETEIGEEEEF